MAIICCHFNRELPTIWDETRVLSADLSDYLVEALRKGDIWYIVAMNHGKPITLCMPLDFLDKGEQANNKKILVIYLTFNHR